MSLRPIATVFAAPVLSLLASSAAHATAPPCVTTVAQLYDALAQSAAQPDNSPLLIRLVQGTYNFGSYYANPSSQLTVAGGYTDATCGTRIVDPDNTVLDFGGTGYLHIYQGSADPIASITLDGITFRHGESVSMYAGGYNQFSPDDAGNVTVRNTRFTDLTANPSGFYFFEAVPVTLQTFKGSVSVVNSIFDHLHQPNPDYTCSTEISLYDDASVVMMFDSIDTAGGNSFCIEPDYDGAQNTVQIFNSIFWPNDGVYGAFQPLHFIDYENNSSPLDVSLYFNTIRGYDGSATVQDFATRSANPQDNPQWIKPIAGAGADYGLLPTSSAINSGFPSGIVAYPSLDIASAPRQVGNFVDRGAVESPYVDSPSTVVTSTADSGAGSLRAAIATANQFDNPDTITFSLPKCPSVIELKTPLPTIHAPVTIDGYAGNVLAHANSDANAFDATLCVIVKEAVPGSILSALAVDTAAGGLTLRGLAFGDFNQQVAILGGSDHFISGNQFGGSVGGINLQGSLLNAIWVHGVTSGNVTIGGLTPGERNVISGASRDGVFMDSTVTTSNCHVNNNLIGLMPDGIGERGNEFGIELQNGNCEIARNRIAANFIDGIWINGGFGNRIQGNVLGLNAAGNPAQSYGWAVRVEGDGNVIGAPQGVAYAPALGNVISFMDTGGVLVNGTNDSVRANLSSFNGVANDGSAPDIELGPVGNAQQKSPVIDTLSLPQALPPGSAQPATIAAHLDSVANASFRIDVYYAATCSPAGRGHAEYYLGTQVVTTDGAGKAAFNLQVTLPDSPPTSALSLTATNALNGNSSAMGACFMVANGGNDTIFKNGFQQ